MKADRVRYDHRTGDVLATGTVDTQIGGRRVRAEKLRYCAETGRIELANLVVEGLPTGASGSTAHYTRARGNGTGGVATPQPPCMPASSRLGVPWLSAATAEAAEDLSRIRGQDGVRLGAGSVVIEGRAFDLDPEARSLEVLEPSVRLRAPQARIEARKLRAALAARRGREATSVKISLEGAVTAQVELPFPLASGRTMHVAASGERLVARPRPRGAVDFTLEGPPARLSIASARVELSAPRIAGKIRGRHVVIQGQLAGRLELVASAFPARRAARRGWTILAAGRIEIAPASARPSWWYGEPESASLPRRVILSDVLVEGDAEPRAELVLFRPTWA